MLETKADEGTLQPTCLPGMWGDHFTTLALVAVLGQQIWWGFPCAVIPNLGSPDVFALQLPEILASRGSGEGFWELESKNIWRPKVGDH